MNEDETTDEYFMQQAWKEAQQAYDEDEIADDQWRTGGRGFGGAIGARAARFR